MDATPPKLLICFMNWCTTYRDYVFKAFLSREAAHAYWSEMKQDYGKSYAELLADQAIIEFDIPAGEYRRIAKDGLFYGASVGTRDAHAYVVSASMAGLVRKAREVRPGCTSLTLFKHSNAGGLFLVEGYLLPEHHLRHQNTALVDPMNLYSG